MVRLFFVCVTSGGYFVVLGVFVTVGQKLVFLNFTQVLDKFW